MTYQEERISRPIRAAWVISVLVAGGYVIIVLLSATEEEAIAAYSAPEVVLFICATMSILVRKPRLGAAMKVSGRILGLPPSIISHLAGVFAGRSLITVFGIRSDPSQAAEPWACRPHLGPVTAFLVGGLLIACASCKSKPDSNSIGQLEDAETRKSQDDFLGIPREIWAKENQSTWSGPKSGGGPEDEGPWEERPIIETEAAEAADQLPAAEIAADAPPTVETLRSALSCDSPSVPGLAKRLFEELGPPALEPLIASLRGRESETGYGRVVEPRDTVIPALKGIGAPAVYPLLKAMKMHDVYGGYWSLPWAVECMGPAAIDPLVVALKGEDSVVRNRAATLLGRMKDPRVREALISALDDDDLCVQVASMHSLLRLGPVGADVLIAALRHDNPGVRYLAAKAAGSNQVTQQTLKDSRTCEALVVSLNDDDRAVRMGAAESLGHFKDMRVVGPLIAVLRKGNDPDVRSNAAQSLGLINDQRAVDALIAALNDNDASVRRRAIVALTRREPLPIEALSIALKHDDQGIRASAALAMARAKDVRAVAPLIAVLTDHQAESRESAARALGELGDSRAVEPLVNALTEWKLCRVAVRALDQLGWQPISVTQRVHYQVAQGARDDLLAQWQQTREVLLADIFSPDASARKNALYALTGLGREEMLPVLASGLHGSDDKLLAESYLNCGQQELEAAAKSWAAERGYEIQSAPIAGEGVGWGNL